MREKMVSMLLLCLVMLSIVAVSGGNDIELCDTDEDHSYMDIPAPENFEVRKEGDDVLLEWDAIEDVSHYKVYYSTDLYSSFPEDWEEDLTSDERWTHEDALLSGENNYYLVRGVEDEMEGRISNTGACVKMDLTYDHDQRLHYVSIPNGFDNRDKISASDIVEHIEGDLKTSEYIDSVVKWDYTQRGYTEAFSYDAIVQEWSGEDFVVEPEATVGLKLVDNLTWSVNAVESYERMEFKYESDARLHYISVPYTMLDRDAGGHITASDVVMDVEGDLKTSEYIDSVVKWDYTERGYTEVFSYEAMSQTWGGDDFIVEPEAAVGLRLVADLEWTPTLSNFEPPIVCSVEIEEDIIVEFSKSMNKTTFEDRVFLDDISQYPEWESEQVMRIGYDDQDPRWQVLTIEASVTDMYGNNLDGDGDGISYGGESDDFVYKIFTGTRPEIVVEQPPEELLLGEAPIITANVTGAEQVFLNYTINDEVHNVSMENNSSYHHRIPPVWHPGTIEYHLTAVDHDGIWNSSEQHTIEVEDPGTWGSSSIIHTSETNKSCKTEDISINVSTTYHVQPVQVNLSFIEPYGHMHNISMQKNIDNWTCAIPAQNRTGILEYWFEIKYENGPTVGSKTYEISLENPIEVDFQDLRGKADENLDFEVILSSPRGVQAATLHMQDDDLSINEDLTLVEGDPGNGTWGATIKLPEGEFDYSLSVVDMDGDDVLFRSNTPLRVDGSEGSFNLLWLVILAVSSAAIAFVVMYRSREKEVEEEKVIATESENSKTENEQVNKEHCIICFGRLKDGENHYTCDGCGSLFHPACIHEVVKCPMCTKEYEGVEDGR